MKSTLISSIATTGLVRTFFRENSHVVGVLPKKRANLFFRRYSLLLAMLAAAELRLASPGVAAMQDRYSPDSGTASHPSLGIQSKQSGEPPERGAPEGRTPLGSPSRPEPILEGRDPFDTRGACGADHQSFTPLLPLPDPDFSGKTLAEHPTFWFYLPYGEEQIESGQFVVSDQAGNLVYGTHFELPTTPGFVQIQLPTTAALVPEHRYRWELTLYCPIAGDDPDNIGLISHRGFITRMINTDLAVQLAIASLEERFQLYAAYALWYDAAAELEELAPRTEAWSRLFTLLELEELAGEAIAGPVILPPTE